MQTAAKSEAVKKVPWRAEMGACLRAQQALGAAAPNAIALEDAQYKLTMPQMQEASSWVARSIWAARAVGTADGGSPTAAIFLDKTVSIVASALGALLAGARIVDVPAMSREAEIVRILRIVQPHIIVTTEALRAKLPEELVAGAAVVLVDSIPLPALDGAAAAGNATPAPLAFEPQEADEGFDAAAAAAVDDGAFCVLTSGTTSLSKLVVCPHAALTCATNYIGEDLLIPPPAGGQHKVGLFWTYYYMLSVMGLGATVYVLPDVAFIDPHALVSNVKDHQLTGLYVTPSIIESALRGVPEERLVEDMASLRVIWLTGERVLPKLRAKLAAVLPNVRVRNIYSTNESGDISITDDDSSFRCLKDVEYQVLDPTSLEPVPYGGEGALFVDCPWLLKGYWTSEGVGFTPGPKKHFRTGDIARWHADGSFEFVSRESGSHVKVRGFKVFPELLEQQLLAHPEVEGAYVAAVGDGDDDTSSRLEAAVALVKESTLGANSLRTFMAERVPSYMVPVNFRDLTGVTSTVDPFFYRGLQQANANANASNSNKAASGGPTKAALTVRPASGADGRRVALSVAFSSGGGTRSNGSNSSNSPEHSTTVSPTLSRVGSTGANLHHAAGETTNGDEETTGGETETTSPNVPNLSGKRLSPKELAKLFITLPDLSDEIAEPLPPNEAVLVKAWAEVLQLPISAFSSKSNFFDYGGSLAFFQLSKALQPQLNGRELPVATLLAAPTLSAMAQVVFAPAQEAASKNDDDFDEVATAAMYPISPPLKAAQPLSKESADLVASATLAKFRAQGNKSVLVTGGTGYLGPFVIEALAKRDGVEKVFAIVRAKSDDAAKERLRDACVKRALDEGEGGKDAFEAWFAKVQVIAGDVGRECFGLSEADYALLGLRIHCIVHAAAEVNMLKPAAALAPTNVGGTAHVFSLAALAALPVLFTSTILPLDGAAPTGYRRSKGAAELLCIEAREKYGVPSAVLQLGDIGIGRSVSPKALPPDDYVLVLLRACIAMGSVPAADWCVSIMSVHDCSNNLATTILDAPDAKMDGVAREKKGGLLEWGTLCNWLAPHLPMLGNALPLPEWKLEVERVAALEGADDAAVAAGVHAKRMTMLLPAMDQEFAAEWRRKENGEGASEDEHVLDASWGDCFGIALAAEHAANLSAAA